MGDRDQLGGDEGCSGRVLWVIQKPKFDFVLSELFKLEAFTSVGVGGAGSVYYENALLRRAIVYRKIMLSHISHLWHINFRVTTEEPSEPSEPSLPSDEAG